MEINMGGEDSFTEEMVIANQSVAITSYFDCNELTIAKI